MGLRVNKVIPLQKKNQRTIHLSQNKMELSFKEMVVHLFK